MGKSLEVAFLEQWSRALERQEYSEALGAVNKRLAAEDAAPARAQLQRLRGITLSRLSLRARGWQGTEDDLRKAKTQKGRCSFCGRRRADAGPLIVGWQASICRDCLVRASKMFGRRTSKASRPLTLVSASRTESPEPCSFCGQRKREQLVRGKDGIFCEQCCAVCLKRAKGERSAP